MIKCHLFLQKCIEISATDAKLVFITPSRWFAGDKGLDKYRKFMLNCGNLKYIKHFDYKNNIFGKGVDIKGGVSYFLFDKTHKGYCNFNDKNIDMSKNDILLLPKHYTILNKLKNHKTLDTIVRGRGNSLFGIATNDRKFSETKIDDNYLKCFVYKQKGYTKYIYKDFIKKDYNYPKLITPNESGNGGDGFGAFYVLDNYEVFSDTYKCFRVNSAEQAHSLKSYLECKLPNYLLSLRKITHHINNDNLNYILLVPLDKIWNDELVFDYFCLDDNDKKIIKENIFA